MIKVKEIKILWSESSKIQDNRTFTCFNSANKYLLNAAYFSPKNGAYDKTKYMCVFSDGAEYTGRIDIVHPDCNIKNHRINEAMRDHLQFYSGEFRPYWMTEEQYHQTTRYNPAQMKSAKEFLETYCLEA